jgi:glycosyltransferase involved in cell wall biosynthesis
MNLSVCICTYDRSALLRQMLASLAQVNYDFSSAEVLLVDNNSTDDTRSVAEAASHSFPQFRYIFEPKQGLSHARNAAIRNARGEIICFVDDDTLLDPGYLRAVQQTFERHNCAGVAGRVEPMWNGPKPAWLALEGKYRVPGPLVYCNMGEEEIPATVSWTGAAMSVIASVFRKHGEFRTELGPADCQVGGGGDDTEMYERLVKAGESIMYSPQALVFHPVVPSRLTREYFRRWYRRHGECDALLEEVRGRRIFGIPPWLWRKTAQHALRYCVAVRQKKRTYYLCQMNYRLGMIDAVRRLTNSSADTIGKELA